MNGRDRRWPRNTATTSPPANHVHDTIPIVVFTGNLKKIPAFIQRQYFSPRYHHEYKALCDTDSRLILFALSPFHHRVIPTRPNLKAPSPFFLSFFFFSRVVRQTCILPISGAIYGQHSWKRHQFNGMLAVGRMINTYAIR